MFQDLYKQNINKDERQEERRKELLNQQKSKRMQQQDDQRQIDEPQVSKSDHYHRRRKYMRNDIANIRLQLSEWLKEKPENFSDWFLVPCPKGQRCLVVVSKGETRMFNRKIRYRMNRTSLLHGGGIIGSMSHTCILDCIYNKELDVFYVLDTLHYLIPLKDCDTEFRFFWLKSKFAELEAAQETYKDDDNITKFKLLNYYDMANEEILAQVLQTYPLWPDNQPPLDGFLFYHKESHYIFGSTPLVCWLFPFMITDVLQLPVSSSYEAPMNYSKENPWQYMDEFDKELENKHCRRKHKHVQDMDLEEGTEENQSSTRIEQDAEFEAEPQEDNLLQTIVADEKNLELEGER